MDNLSKVLLSLNPFRSHRKKQIIQDYVENYALSKNPKYPYFVENDCTNFISQCIHEAGAKQKYGIFHNENVWFCKTTDASNLSNISLSWRAAKNFRIYWANPYTKNYRAHYYREMSANEAIDDFTNLIYEKLEVGDVVQFINLKKSPYPYHTQVVHRKALTTEFPYTNLFVAQHTKDRKDVSLHTYIRSVENKDDTIVCIYKILD